MRVFRSALIIVATAAGCTQPLRLARDDSGAVLSQLSLGAPNPGQPGTLRVRRLFYGSGTDRRRAEYRDSVTIKTTAVDGSKLISAKPPSERSRKRYWGFGFDKLPLNGRVWYPEGEGPFPLVLIVHGNHDPKDFSDPGYEYLGVLLASRGYIMVSVDENFLNGDLQGENDGRGWLLLHHVLAWKRFNDSIGGPFHHKVDLANVALMGHSRGGEAVAIAGLFNRLRHDPDDANVEFDFNLGIKALVAIAPIDGQYEPAQRPTPLENVNYLLIHGSHDGDVSAFSGLRQYERIRFTDRQPWFKSAVWMYRANHGQWNTGWGKRDYGKGSERFLALGGLIDPESQRQFARVYISAFLDATLKGRTEYLPLFQDHRLIGPWLPKTMYVTRFEESGFQTLADFGEDVDLNTGTSSGVRIEGDSLATWREGLLPLRWKDYTAGHSGVWVGWNNRIEGSDTAKRGRPAAYRLTLTDSLRAAWQVGTGTAVTLSLAPTDDTPPPRKPAGDSTAKKTVADSAAKPPPKPKAKPSAADSLPPDLSVELVDGHGASARVALSRYGPIRKPLSITVYRRRGSDAKGFATTHELVLQTYVLPFEDFRAANPSFDPATVRTVGLVFDRTVAGTVVVTDIGLSNRAGAFIAERR